jgi:hypothetical protein
VARKAATPLSKIDGALACYHPPAFPSSLSEEDI